MADRMFPDIKGGGYSSDIICLEGNGYRPSHKGDGWAVGGAMYTLNSTEVHAVCYSLSSFNSNAMKSENPQSGIYVADTARTLDLNGGSPACNQGGILVLERKCYAVDCRNGMIDECVNGSLQTSANHNMNSSNVVLVSLS